MASSIPGESDVTPNLIIDHVTRDTLKADVGAYLAREADRLALYQEPLRHLGNFGPINQIRGFLPKRGIIAEVILRHQPLGSRHCGPLIEARVTKAAA
jgi:hypothetical protein